MFDNARMLEMIERALDERSVLSAVRRPDHASRTIDGRLWLVCSAADAPAGSWPASAP